MKKPWIVAIDGADSGSLHSSEADAKAFAHAILMKGHRVRVRTEEGYLPQLVVEPGNVLDWLNAK